MNFPVCTLYIFSWILVTVGVLFQLCGGVTDLSRWIFDAGASGIECPMEAIRGTHVYSLLKCGSLCSTENLCTSFTFDKTSTPNCYLMNMDPSLLTNCYSKPNTKHYMMLITSVANSCHLGDGNYRAYRLNDGNIFKISMIPEWLVTSQARAACLSTGGFLVKVSTMARLEFLDNILKACPMFYLMDYIIGGSNDNEDAIWRWEDGEPIDMTSSIWQSNMPNDIASSNCLYFKNGGVFNYVGWVSTHYICEKP